MTPASFGKGGRTMAICLDTEFSTHPNAKIGVTKIVSFDELKELSDKGYTHTMAAKHFDVPDSTFRTFLNRNRLRYLFTKNKRNHLDNQQKEMGQMKQDGTEGVQ